ncbi:MAG: phosphodiester glycosidase family protein, partial [Bacteroidota bacterium]
NGAATYSKASGGGLTYHMVKVDMSHASVLITRQGRRMSVSTTEHFLKANKLQLAINGDGFRYRRDKRDYELEPAGFASSKGRQYGKLGREQTIFISKDKQFSLTKPARKADIWDAISFPNLLVKDGSVAWSKATPAAPRTCLGWTQDQKTLIILVVDGREIDQTGMTLETCAQVLKQEGAWVGVNMDGGGSSTLVIEEKGAPLVLNVPTDDNIFGKQRPVLNHFGLYIS